MKCSANSKLIPCLTVLAPAYRPQNKSQFFIGTQRVVTLQISLAKKRLIEQRKRMGGFHVIEEERAYLEKKRAIFENRLNQVSPIVFADCTASMLRTTSAICDPLHNLQMIQFVVNYRTSSLNTTAARQAVCRARVCSMCARPPVFEVAGLGPCHRA